MKKQKVALGEIILIPISGGFVQAKILFLSKRDKDVMLLGIYTYSLDMKQYAVPVVGDFAATYYASKQAILKGKWSSTGIIEPLSETEHQLSKRVDAGNLWLENQYLGPATHEDERTFPQMDVYGSALLEKKVALLFQPQKPLS
jgi:hypothetical protein